MKSVRGIYYNLKESEYKLHIKEYTFIFSSLFYLNKFKNEYESFINDETIKMNIKYNTKFNMENVLLLALYKKIEKRGFLVYKNNDIISEGYLVDSIIK